MTRESHRGNQIRRGALAYLARLGLLINFHVAFIKDGITRIVNGLQEDDHARSRQDLKPINAPETDMDRPAPPSWT
jgi:hypothetical protein